jgi:hypothetical protein
MAINGTHMLFYTSEAEKLRAMLRDVFGFKHVDAGGGWLIFRLPPSEIGVHPAEGPTWDSGTRHEISFMCDDIHQTVAELRAKGVAIDDQITTQSYGITATLRLPGGCKATLYQPRHKIAAEIKAKSTKKKPAAKKTAKKSVRLRQQAAARPPRGKRAMARRGRRAKTAGRRR